MSGGGWGWTVATGAVIAAVGLLATSAAGMASAPTRWSGIGAMALLVVGGAMIVLGLAALARPELRPLARRITAAVALAVALLFFLNQILIRTGIIDG